MILAEEENLPKPSIRVGEDIRDPACTTHRQPIAWRAGLQTPRHLRFPADLTADIARERNLTIDLDGYNAPMEEQKQRCRLRLQRGLHPPEPQRAHRV